MISTSALASMIDHTLLRPDATEIDIRKLCLEAIEYNFASVCVNPVRVNYAVDLLSDSGVMVCSVVGFPLGNGLSKFHETEQVVKLGADEIDMVIALGFLKDGLYHAVKEDIRAVVKAAQSRPVKVILETCYLTREEKIISCRLAEEAGAFFVKTSTGFGSGGATPEDVALLAASTGENIGVKASGGISTWKKAVSMIEAGASRLGCSASVSIVNEVSGG